MRFSSSCASSCLPFINPIDLNLQAPPGCSTHLMNLSRFPRRRYTQGVKPLEILTADALAQGADTPIA